uniref:Uncharacterized protein n=1 Tax=Anopheles maculatus TaxID=74869 RepID=A0A182SG08_9DIPT
MDKSLPRTENVKTTAFFVLLAVGIMIPPLPICVLGFLFVHGCRDVESHPKDLKGADLRIICSGGTAMAPVLPSGIVLPAAASRAFPASIGNDEMIKNSERAVLHRNKNIRQGTVTGLA